MNIKFIGLTTHYPLLMLIKTEEDNSFMYHNNYIKIKKKSIFFKQIVKNERYLVYSTMLNYLNNGNFNHHFSSI